jgi:hypothetical protein
MWFSVGFLLPHALLWWLSASFRFGCVKSRPWWSLLLGVWLARDIEFSPIELEREGHSLLFSVVVGGSVFPDVVHFWKAFEDDACLALTSFGDNDSRR